MDRVLQWYLGVPPRLVIRLLALPVALSVLDFSVTLFFQPAAYWAGDRMAVVEANPIARWVLIIHPLLIVPAMVVWYLLMFPLIFRAPAKFGLRVIVAHLVAHTIVISGWLIRMLEGGWWWVALLAALVSLLSVIVLGRFRRQWNGSRPLHEMYPAC